MQLILSIAPSLQVEQLLGGHPWIFEGQLQWSLWVMSMLIGLLVLSLKSVQIHRVWSHIVLKFEEHQILHWKVWRITSNHMSEHIKTLTMIASLCRKCKKKTKDSFTSTVHEGMWASCGSVFLNIHLHSLSGKLCGKVCILLGSNVLFYFFIWRN